MKKIALAATLMLLVTGCSPEIGSEKWCAKMKEKPNGDWTQTETVEFAKNCIFKFGDKNDS